MIGEFLLYLLGAISGWWIACRFRLCPVPWMRFWYAVCFLFTLIPLNLTTLIVSAISRLGLLPSMTAGRLNWYLTSVLFKAFAFMTPHIRHIPLHGAKTDKVFIDGGKDPRILCCSNHTSFNDGFAILAVTPSNLVWNVRAMYKSSLAKIPLWGATYARRNDFAVHFTSSDKFTTDKEKQAAEAQRMADWVDKENGGVSLFPEGQLNPDPFKIQPVRFGMIKFAREHKMNIYVSVQMGSYVAWPLDAQIGGIPTDLVYDNRKFEILSESETVEETALRLQKTMQEMVDEIVVFMKKHNLNNINNMKPVVTAKKAE